MSDNTIVLQRARITPKEVAFVLGLKDSRTAKKWCESRGIHGHPLGEGEKRPRLVYSYDRVMQQIKAEDAELHGEELEKDIILKELEGLKKILKSLKGK